MHLGTHQSHCGNKQTLQILLKLLHKSCQHILHSSLKWSGLLALRCWYVFGKSLTFCDCLPIKCCTPFQKYSAFKNNVDSLTPLAMFLDKIYQQLKEKRYLGQFLNIVGRQLRIISFHHFLHAWKKTPLKSDYFFFISGIKLAKPIYISFCKQRSSKQERNVAMSQEAGFWITAVINFIQAVL